MLHHAPAALSRSPLLHEPPTSAWSHSRPENAAQPLHGHTAHTAHLKMLPNREGRRAGCPASPPAAAAPPRAVRMARTLWPSASTARTFASPSTTATHSSGATSPRPRAASSSCRAPRQAVSKADAALRCASEPPAAAPATRQVLRVMRKRESKGVGTPRKWGAAGWLGTGAWLGLAGTGEEAARVRGATCGEGCHSNESMHVCGS